MENITYFKSSSTFEAASEGGTLKYPNASLAEDTLHLGTEYVEEAPYFTVDGVKQYYTPGEAFNEWSASSNNTIGLAFDDAYFMAGISVMPMSYYSESGGYRYLKHPNGHYIYGNSDATNELIESVDYITVSSAECDADENCGCFECNPLNVPKY